MTHRPHFGVSVPLLIGLISLVWVALGAMPASTKAAGAVKTTAAGAGKQLFQANCSSCHGANGAGGIKVGDATSADLRQSKLEPAYRKNVKLLQRAILDGKDEDGGNLNQVMPRWKGKLTTRQVDNIIAYLKTLK
jgi:mono/diheme cytochrome c family protein